MRCVVTAGPTWEPLDDVRRLTNFSTGRLGTELANYLVGQGHEVSLLLGELATYHVEIKTHQVARFSTTRHLKDLLQAEADRGAGAVFHTAAVSDFAFGKLWQRQEGQLQPEPALGKITSHRESLLVELVPTPKLIGFLREWFPAAVLVGWKFEVDGNAKSAIDKARLQMEHCRLNASVANGPAYGQGYGLIRSRAEVSHCDGLPELGRSLHELMGKSTSQTGAPV